MEIRNHRAWTLAVAAITVSCLATGPVALAQPSSTDAATSLRIAVTNGVSEAKNGDRLRYQISVTNLAGRNAAGVSVTLRLPRGTSAADLDGTATVDQQVVRWSIDVPAHETTTLTATGVIDSIAEGTNGLAVSACADLSAERRRICSTDMDQVVGAAPLRGQTADDGSLAWSLPWWQLAGAAAVLLLVALVSILVLVRRKHLGRSRDAEVPAVPEQSDASSTEDKTGVR